MENNGLILVVLTGVQRDKMSSSWVHKANDLANQKNNKLLNQK
jgi:hypothetical protein